MRLSNWTGARAQIAGAEQDVINAQGILEQQEVLIKTVLTRRGSREPASQSAHLIVTDTLAVPETEPATSIQELLKQAEEGTIREGPGAALVWR